MTVEFEYPDSTEEEYFAPWDSTVSLGRNVTRVFVDSVLLYLIYKEGWPGAWMIWRNSDGSRAIFTGHTAKEALANFAKSKWSHHEKKRWFYGELSDLLKE